ncbi:MAG: IPExxxVDY family protein [Flavobacterium sp.]|nr:MAG: IPExxxVDY family protein [Flavobacterium sp.]
MATFKLSIDEFDEVNYELIAIHTSLEDYHLAYFINQNFPVLLSRNPNEVQVQTREGETAFSRYTFEHHENGICWDLLQNKSETVASAAGDLFFGASQQISAIAYLLPEFKKVDYFLKISISDSNPGQVLEKLAGINNITTVYPIDIDRVKSKNNLIF